MTGEQNILKGGAWQEVVGVTGLVILQNQSPAHSMQYYIGIGAPTTEIGVNLPSLNEHRPNIRASETLYARSLNANAQLAWSE